MVVAAAGCAVSMSHEHAGRQVCPSPAACSAAPPLHLSASPEPQPVCFQTGSDSWWLPGSEWTADPAHLHCHHFVSQHNPCTLATSDSAFGSLFLIDELAVLQWPLFCSTWLLFTLTPQRQGLEAKVLLLILIPHSQGFGAHGLFIRYPSLITQAEAPAIRSHSCCDTVVSLFR